MSLMTGFPLVGHLMQIRLGGRFRHLSPSVAAELEAFAAEQEAATAKPAAAGPPEDGCGLPSPRVAPRLRLREAC
ncbi:hypothetical protein ACFW16_26300 [Inquilinus sp. NPDC058860]|uniref:hypothetical protein n=1 Tax=Inquilinus sp. NPDC058860 TaxID=3346652 RepID=UPI00368E4C2C